MPHFGDGGGILLSTASQLVTAKHERGSKSLRSPTLNSDRYSFEKLHMHSPLDSTQSAHSPTELTKPLSLSILATPCKFLLRSPFLLSLLPLSFSPSPHDWFRCAQPQNSRRIDAFIKFGCSAISEKVVLVSCGDFARYRDRLKNDP